MNESRVSTKFQTLLRQALPEAVVVKHADRSMIGMVDASVTYNKKTIWLEYKYVAPKTAGVAWRPFLHDGVWDPLSVASASPTQLEMAKRLAIAGHCYYLFWVLDHTALRMKIKHVVLWDPINGGQTVFPDTDAVVRHFIDLLHPSLKCPYKQGLGSEVQCVLTKGHTGKHLWHPEP
jgi:hypothetical protein